MSKYKHEEELHNLKDPGIIVPEVINLLNPKSVVDIGCGLGTFLNVFKRLGVNDVLGVDGPWVNKNFLYKNINSKEFLEWDLEEEIKLNKKFDLAISLEVAEHVSEESADTFVKSLVNSGKLILFSAAIPYQGGQNHINEQLLNYWEEKFSKYNLVVHDIFRPLFWDNPEIQWWYKQNMVLFAPKEFKLSSAKEPFPVRNIVHYELFRDKLDNIFKGKEKTWQYMKWLILSIFGYDFVTKLKLKLTRSKV